MLAMVAVSLSWLGVKQRLYRKGRLLSRPFFVGVMLLANILKTISIDYVSKSKRMQLRNVDSEDLTRT